MDASPFPHQPVLADAVLAAFAALTDARGATTGAQDAESKASEPEDVECRASTGQAPEIGRAHV